MSFDNTYIHCGKAMKMSNKYNVFASLLSAKPEDAGMIAAWMADREAEKDVMNIEVVTCRHDATRLNEVRGDYDGNISVGDVRILSKQFTSEPDVIPYVAVLEEWEKGMWLIAPFSHYATPATPGEMSTGIDMRGLRVLQAWNGRTVQDDILKKSFLFDRLSAKVREDALALFRHEMGGVDLLTSFSALRGVPIVNETDPRREYIAESIDRLQPLAKVVVDMTDRMNNIFDRTVGMSVTPVFGKEYALAAADERRNPFAKGVIEGSDVAVTVEYEMDKKILRVKVRNTANMYEGWSVWTTSNVDPQELGIIGNGLLVVHNVDEESLRVGLAFASPDGKTIKRCVLHKTSK